ncbi:MAG: hypothetical protein HON90_02610 [Halobacteriovoraceae bacterium]|jgi:hypothetical protein|nr:hypothetical protein [Halobacteriovoraceae bacterium]
MNKQQRATLYKFSLPLANLGVIFILIFTTLHTKELDNQLLFISYAIISLFALVLLRLNHGIITLHND